MNPKRIRFGDLQSSTSQYFPSFGYVILSIEFSGSGHKGWIVYAITQLAVYTPCTFTYLYHLYRYIYIYVIYIYIYIGAIKNVCIYSSSLSNGSVAPLTPTDPLFDVQEVVSLSATSTG